MRKLAVLLLSVFIAVQFFGCKADEQQPVSEPITITVWTYYNGAQQESFEQIVAQFNDSYGAKNGITVNHLSQSGINELSAELISSVDKEVGSQNLPDLAMVYPETAYKLNKMDSVVSYDKYFTKEEIEEYVPAFIDEGRLTEGGELYIFPVAKSTEVFIYNKTDWADFAKATDIYPENIKTTEDIAAAAESYYSWTDSLTPHIADDGKALFGRDALDNYMVVGSAQLGNEIMRVDSSGEICDLDENTLKTLWDNYYVPFINGYYAADGKFRSDDAKTGTILALVGSTASSSYFPTSVTLGDDTEHDIEVGIIAAPKFKDSVVEYSVQQGAGFAMMKSDESKQEAASKFLKWFTAKENNTAFAVDSGYLPVKIEANTNENILSSAKGGESNSVIMQNLSVGSDIMRSDKLYINKPFDKMAEARQIIKASITDISKNDRQIVLEKISGGMDRASAVSDVNTYEHFKEWFDSLSSELKNITK